MNYIYKITNTKNNKLYIGKTSRTIQERFCEHIYAAQRKKYVNRPLYAAMNKYGISNFIIEEIDRCETEQEASELEIYYISYYDTYQNGYNATLGGEGTATYTFCDKEILKKYKELKSIRAVAREYCVDEKTIRNIIHRYNLHIYSKKEQIYINNDKILNRNEKILNRYNKLQSIRKVGLEFGLSRETVRRIVKRYQKPICA